MTATAKKQAAKSAHGRAHAPDLDKLYRRQVEGLDPSSLEYRTTLLRPSGVTPHSASYDHLITSVDWRYDEGDPVMHGSLSLIPRQQWNGAAISEGDVLKLDCLWFGHWTEVWRMMLVDEQDQIGSGVSYSLESPDFILQQSKDDWHYAKSKKGGHPNGWRCDQIARDVARRYRIPLGQVAKGQRQIHSLSYDGYSPLQILQRAYALEKSSTGHRFVMRWQRGRLNILPMRRNPLLYVLHDLLQDALLTRADRGTDFATAGTVRATVKDAKGKHRKVTVQVRNDAAVRKNGFVHAVLGVGDVKDAADAREKGLRKLNKVSQRKRVLSGISHPLIPFIFRGDAIQVSVPERGLSGARAIGFVSAGTWSLSGGVGTMSLDVTFDDPYATTSVARKAKDKATRAKKRKK